MVLRREPVCPGHISLCQPLISNFRCLVNFIHLIGVDLSRQTRNVTAFELADG